MALTTPRPAPPMHRESVLRYTSETPPTPVADLTTPGSQVRICPTREPEVHELGEFPMSCYRCHVEADS